MIIKKSAEKEERIEEQRSQRKPEERERERERERRKNAPEKSKWREEWTKVNGCRRRLLTFAEERKGGGKSGGSGAPAPHKKSQKNRERHWGRRHAVWQRWNKERRKEGTRGRKKVIMILSCSLILFYFSFFPLFSFSCYSVSSRSLTCRRFIKVSFHLDRLSKNKRIKQKKTVQDSARIGQFAGPRRPFWMLSLLWWRQRAQLILLSKWGLIPPSSLHTLIAALLLLLLLFLLTAAILDLSGQWARRDAGYARLIPFQRRPTCCSSVTFNLLLGFSGRTVDGVSLASETFRNEIRRNRWRWRTQSHQRSSSDRIKQTSSRRPHCLMIINLIESWLEVDGSRDRDVNGGSEKILLISRISEIFVNCPIWIEALQFRSKQQAWRWSSRQSLKVKKKPNWSAEKFR